MVGRTSDRQCYEMTPHARYLSCKMSSHEKKAEVCNCILMGFEMVDQLHPLVVLGDFLQSVISTSLSLMLKSWTPKLYCFDLSPWNLLFAYSRFIHGFGHFPKDIYKKPFVCFRCCHPPSRRVFGVHPTNASSIPPQAILPAGATQRPMRDFSSQAACHVYWIRWISLPAQLPRWVLEMVFQACPYLRNYTMGPSYL